MLRVIVGMASLPSDIHVNGSNMYTVESVNDLIVNHLKLPESFSSYFSDDLLQEHYYFNYHLLFKTLSELATPNPIHGLDKWHSMNAFFSDLGVDTSMFNIYKECIVRKRGIIVQVLGEVIYDV